jgi:hypothetical protein
MKYRLLAKDTSIILEMQESRVLVRHDRLLYSSLICLQKLSGINLQ